MLYTVWKMRSTDFQTFKSDYFLNYLELGVNAVIVFFMHIFTTI